MFFEYFHSLNSVTQHNVTRLSGYAIANPTYEVYTKKPRLQKQPRLFINTMSKDAALQRLYVKASS